jgi:hypothetical protein
MVRGSFEADPFASLPYSMTSQICNEQAPLIIMNWLSSASLQTQFLQAYQEA